MRINSMTLIHADQTIDRYGVVLSMFSNWIVLALKIGQFVCRLRTSPSDPWRHYWEYVQDKSWSKCLILSLPLPGLTNLIVYLLDYRNEQVAAAATRELTTGQPSDHPRGYDYNMLKKDRAFVLQYFQCYLNSRLANSNPLNGIAIELFYDQECLTRLLQMDRQMVLEHPRYKAVAAIAPDYVAACQQQTLPSPFSGDGHLLGENA